MHQTICDIHECDKQTNFLTVKAASRRCRKSSLCARKGATRLRNGAHLAWAQAGHSRVSLVVPHSTQLLPAVRGKWPLMSAPGLKTRPLLILTLARCQPCGAHHRRAVLPQRGAWQCLVPVCLAIEAQQISKSRTSAMRESSSYGAAVLQCGLRQQSKCGLSWSRLPMPACATPSDS